MSSLGEPLPALWSSRTALTTSTTPKESHKFSWSDTVVTSCVEPRTPSRQLATTLTMPTIISLARRLIQDSARTSFYSMSRCHQRQPNCEAGRSSVNSNHCFKIASFRERLGSISIMAERQQHLALFQVDTSEKPFVMAQTLP